MRPRATGIGVALSIALVIAVALLTRPLWAVDHDALWAIVHGRCVPDQSDHGDPAPCAAVDLSGRFAVLKDINGSTQFLLIPTDRVAGIEDASILSDHAPNYWQAAWNARHFVSQRAGKPLPDDQIALAINSEFARSQNQLHIHIDCIRPDVHEALGLLQPGIGPGWSHASLLSQDYDVRLLNADDLASQDLFSLVAGHLQQGQTMAAETIVVAGAVLPDGRAGLDLLVGRDGVGGNNGNGETLQDHGCAIAKTR